MAVLPIRDRAYLVERGIAFEEVDGNEKGDLPGLRPPRRSL